MQTRYCSLAVSQTKFDLSAPSETHRSISQSSRLHRPHEIRPRLCAGIAAIIATHPQRDRPAALHRLDDASIGVADPGSGCAESLVDEELDDALDVAPLRRAVELWPEELRLHSAYVVQSLLQRCALDSGEVARKICLAGGPVGSDGAEVVGDGRKWEWVWARKGEGGGKEKEHGKGVKELHYWSLRGVIC